MLAMSSTMKGKKEKLPQKILPRSLAVHLAQTSTALVRNVAHAQSAATALVVASVMIADLEIGDHEIVAIAEAHAALATVLASVVVTVAAAMIVAHAVVASVLVATTKDADTALQDKTAFHVVKIVNSVPKRDSA